MTTTTSSTALQPKEVADFLRVCIKARRNTFVWGPPGVGKTAVITQLAAEMGIPLTVKIAAQMDATDVAGLPFIDELKLTVNRKKDPKTSIIKRSNWATPLWLPLNGPHIIFLDELPNATTLVLNSLQKLINEREVNDYKLPDGVVFIAAGNRVADRAGANRVTSAINSRFVHVDFEPSLQDWCQWAVTSGIDPMTIAFLRYRPELFHKFDKDAREFPCPRTWEFVSQITSTPVGGASKKVQLALLAGTVGRAVAVEYMAFVELYKQLPSIDAILMNPDKAAVPTDVSGMYAVSAALARRADAKNFGRVIKYLDRLPEEYNVMAVRDAISRDASLQSAAEFTKWSIKHQGAIG